MTRAMGVHQRFGMLLRAAAFGTVLHGRALADDEAASAASTDARPKDVESFVLNFNAPASCPSREDFQALTQALTPAARFRSPSDEGGDLATASRRLSIVISARKTDFFGTLELVDDRARATRQFDAGTCDEIVEALALATALAIDPSALDEPASANDQPKEPAAAEPALTDAAEPAVERRFHLSLGLRGELFWLNVASRDAPFESGVSRRNLLVPSVSPTLEFDARVLGFWSSASLSVGYAWSAPTDVDLRWVPNVRMGLCPAWWVPVGALRLAPCVGGVIGGLLALPNEEITQAGDARRTWGALDFVGRIEGTWGRLRAGGHAGVATSLVEIPYQLDAPSGSPERLLTIHRRFAPVLGVSAAWQLF